ncbi:MAG: helix-turn-helix domain-containing protein [Bacteroidales bacterium]
MDTDQIILWSIKKDEFKQWIKEAIDEMLNRKDQAQPHPEAEELLSRKEVAKIYKTSLVTLRQWEKDGIIPKPIRKGSRVYFRKSEIMKDIGTEKK